MAYLDIFGKAINIMDARDGITNYTAAFYYGTGTQSYGITNEEICNFGTRVGIGTSSKGPLSSDPVVASFEMELSGETTLEYDNGYKWKTGITTVGSPTGSAGCTLNLGKLYDTDGETVISDQSGQTPNVCITCPTPGTNTSYERQNFMLLVRIPQTNYAEKPAYAVLTCYKTWKWVKGNLESVTISTPRSWVFNPNKYETTVEEIPEPEPPDDPFDPSEPGPYIPDPDDTSDLIPIPSPPGIGVTNAGFINVYNPSAGALQGLGDVLFPPMGSTTDLVTGVLYLCETLANQNLINYVIDCHVIPVQPTQGANSNIKVGYRNTEINVPTVSSDYVDVSCGSISLPEYFGGFADYLTKARLFLPFVGFVDLKPEFWQAGTLAVDYRFNVIDGSFMAYVRAQSSKSQLAGSVIAQFAGNACMHFPITGANYSAMVSGIIGAGIAAASGGSSQAVLGAAYSAANVLAQGPEVQQSNGYNSTSGLLGVRTPYLMIERPVPSYPANYAHDKGYPSNISTLLSNVSGFTIIDDIDLSGIPLMEVELNELRALLKEGVYF